MPEFLYHAAPLKVFLLIKEGGLKALSVGGRDGNYLCASSKESGAATLQARANDVIFRIDSNGDDAWYEQGAGKSEWRRDSGVPPEKLTCRRNQKKAPNHQNNEWISVDDYQAKYGIITHKGNVMESK